MALTNYDRSEIVFFDVETTVPTQRGQGSAILEFGAILVCPEKLEELRSYSTLVRPADLSHISSLTDRYSGITKEDVMYAPSFGDIADIVYDLLNGRIWAGHNILKFDFARVREAFAEIQRPPPEPRGTIDSLALLRQKFGTRAGDMEMASLATYFGLGQHTHRSLDDVRLNLEVLKHCATVLFLESSVMVSYKQPFGCDGFFGTSEISVSAVTVKLVDFYPGAKKIQINYQDSPLQLQCLHLKVRFGINTKFMDHVGRPKLNIVVNAPASLWNILDQIDSRAKKLSFDSGCTSEWRPLVSREPRFCNTPTVRLNLPTVTDGENTQLATEIYQIENFEASRAVFNRFDVGELQSLCTPGDILDACLALDTYDYQQGAGIRLIAKKLMVYSR